MTNAHVGEAGQYPQTQDSTVDIAANLNCQAEPREHRARRFLAWNPPKSRGRMPLSADLTQFAPSFRDGSGFTSVSGRTGFPIKEQPGAATDNLQQVNDRAWPLSRALAKRSLHQHVLDLVADSTQCDNTFVHHSHVKSSRGEVIKIIQTTIQPLPSPWLPSPSPTAEAPSYYGLETDLDPLVEVVEILPNSTDHVQLDAYKHCRSLTQSRLHIDTMATVDTIPGSPPDLSESRSSKTSSYASDTSQHETLSANIMNFEDISLGDDRPASDVSARELSFHDDKENVPAGPTKSPKRPSLSTLQTSRSKTRLREDGINSAIIPTRRTFTSPVVPLQPQFSRTRSTSPMTRAMHSSRNALSPATALYMKPQRRASWQPQRKSVAQIESEYHDSDDELPDDASLFNVPISPYPGMYPGMSPSMNWSTRSQRSSARGSPERESPAHSPAPIPLAHAISAPDSPPSRRTMHSQTVPRHRMPHRSASHHVLPQPPTSPRSGPSRNGRTRSWNMALSELSDEARSITEKLEFHIENGETITTSPQRASAPSAIPLPPIQRGTLDFMPISKEKEAVLSRTRPSWLPPKDPQEERRHLQQYQQMMKASLEADRKREEKKRQMSEDETRDSLIRIWAYYIEPTTDINTIDSRVNDLCWKGIPQNLRGRVWQRKIGNPLGLTKEIYVESFGRAQAIQATPVSDLSKQDKRVAAWLADIERDAETAFPDLRVFQQGGQHWQDLINVCKAYACYRDDAGYFYGMQLMAAVLLLQLSDPVDVFILLANCLNRALPSSFQTADMDSSNRTLTRIKASLETKLPRLHQYLFGPQDAGNLGFSGPELFAPMLKTLFANGLDADRLCRAWDIWIFEGDRWLIRIAVALLAGLQQQILDIEGDMDLRRRNVQEMLGWGPFNRTGGYWTPSGDVESFVDLIHAAGKLEAF